MRPTDADLDELLTLAAYVEGDHNPRGRRVKAARQLADVIPELVSVIRELRSRGGAL